MIEKTKKLFKIADMFTILMAFYFIPLFFLLEYSFKAFVFLYYDSKLSVIVSSGFALFYGIIMFFVLFIRLILSIALKSKELKKSIVMFVIMILTDINIVLCYAFFSV